MKSIRPFFHNLKGLSLALLATAALALAAQLGTMHAHAAIPVILDTDIGDDIDDTWALGLLLKSPELDLKLAVGDNGKSQVPG